MQFTYQHEGVRYTVTLEREADGDYRAVIDGTAYRISADQRSTDHGAITWRLVIDGERHTVISAAAGHERHLHAAGAALTLTVPEARRRRSASSSADDLTAQMPGQVRAVLVEAGARVNRGDVLLILEAMKMEIRVTAPSDGVVTAVLINVGDVVARDQRLLTFTAG